MVTTAPSTKEQDGFFFVFILPKNKTNLNFPILLMHFNLLFILTLSTIIIIVCERYGGARVSTAGYNFVELVFSSYGFWG